MIADMVPDMIPRAVAMRSRVVAGITIEVHVLENGKVVVAKEGFEAFLAACQDGSLSAREVIETVLWVRHGDA